MAASSEDEGTLVGGAAAAPVAGPSDQRLLFLFLPANVPGTCDREMQVNEVKRQQNYKVTVPCSVSGSETSECIPRVESSMELARGMPGSVGGRTYTSMITENSVLGLKECLDKKVSPFVLP